YDTKERPSRPAKERGGPLRHPDVITLPSPTTTHTPGARHHHPSSPTASFAPPRIVTQVVVQHLLGPVEFGGGHRRRVGDRVGITQGGPGPIGVVQVRHV